MNWIEAAMQWEGMNVAGTGLVWLVTGCLLIAGLIGCILPVLPGHLILLIAVISHHLMHRWLLGVDAGLHWWSYAVLIALMAISQTFEFVSGAAGTRWFGGTKWGVAGALIGSLAGMFFLPFGLLLGPLLGAFGFELAFARQELKQATTSGVGSLLGTVAGMIVKLIIGVLMIGWFFLDVWVIGG